VFEQVASHCSLTLIFWFSRSVPCAPAGAKNTMNANKMAKQRQPGSDFREWERLALTLDWKEELERWLKPFLDRLGHKARRRMCPLYVSGLIGSWGTRMMPAGP
jgi:hypothetical protein